MRQLVADNVVPESLIVRACSLERAEFVASFSGDRLLSVQLSGRSKRLRAGLEECPTDGGGPWYARSESTGTNTVLGRLDPDALRQHLDSVPPPFDARAMLGMLETATHYFMPLRKRASSLAYDAERISVGRSHENDVVLIDASVSKHHAWLEYDDRDRLYVGDAGSTNFTRVGGRLVAEGELVHFAPGDELRFGDVVVRVVSAEVLWDALALDS